MSIRKELDEIYGMLDPKNEIDREIREKITKISKMLPSNKVEQEDKMAKLERLYEMKEEMEALVEEAEKLLEGTKAESRAKAYWLAQMEMALSNDHSYLGSAGCTMEETLEELREEIILSFLW